MKNAAELVVGKTSGSCVKLRRLEIEESVFIFTCFYLNMLLWCCLENFKGFYVKDYIFIYIYVYSGDTYISIFLIGKVGVLF